MKAERKYFLYSADGSKWRTLDRRLANMFLEDFAGCVCVIYSYDCFHKELNLYGEDDSK
jgi:hypothetical protein